MIIEQYKGYSIEEVSNRNPYARGIEYMIYPTIQGVQHDADYDGDGFVYCGNCHWFYDLGDAKDWIEYLINKKQKINN